MQDKSNNNFDVFFSVNGLNSLNTKQITSIFQTMRITNQIRFYMTCLINESSRETNPVFQERVNIEIYSLIASLYLEGVKEFYRSNHFKTLAELTDNDQIIADLREYQKRIDNHRKNNTGDLVLKVIDLIRHNFFFHMDEKLFKGLIIDGKATDDWLIGLAKSEMLKDWLFLASYEALITKIAECLNKAGHQDVDVYDWMYSNIFKEAIYFCELLENLIASFATKYFKKVSKRK